MMSVMLILSACASSGPKTAFTLHEDKENHIRSQEYRTEDTFVGQEYIKLPGGDYPAIKWDVISPTSPTSPTCNATEMNYKVSPPMPLGPIAIQPGAQYPSDVMFAISCPAGATIKWVRTIPWDAPTKAAPTATPVK